MKVEKHSSTAEQQQEKSQQASRKPLVWTREKINELIELYKKHECLWNHWHDSYKSKDKRNRAMEDICTSLHITKFEFGKKIHNLRNQFNTEMKKFEQRVEEVGVSIDDATTTELRCKWSHFDSLMFLRHVIEPRPGGYQATFQTPKKMRSKFDFNSAKDDTNVTAVTTSKSSSNSTNNVNSLNQDDVTQFQYDDTGSEEVATDDYQTFENEIVEVGQRASRDETYNRKYQPPQQTTNQELTTIASRTYIIPTNNAKPKQSQRLTSQSSSACSSSQTDIVNMSEDSSIIELNSNKLTIPTSTSSSTSISAISAIASSSSNRPTSVLRDQWDAFGELVANEFRNLNSELSRKRLKRKIMLSMLEVGEEDDNLTVSRTRSN